MCLSADTARVHKTAAKRIFLYFFYRLAFLLPFGQCQKVRRNGLPIQKQANEEAVRNN